MVKYRLSFLPRNVSGFAVGAEQIILATVKSDMISPLSDMVHCTCAVNMLKANNNIDFFVMRSYARGVGAICRTFFLPIYLSIYRLQCTMCDLHKLMSILFYCYYYYNVLATQNLLHARRVIKSLT